MGKDEISEGSLNRYVFEDNVVGRVDLDPQANWQGREFTGRSKNEGWYQTAKGRPGYF